MSESLAICIMLHAVLMQIAMYSDADYGMICVKLEADMAQVGM